MIGPSHAVRHHGRSAAPFSLSICDFASAVLATVHPFICIYDLYLCLCSCLNLLHKVGDNVTRCNPPSYLALVFSYFKFYRIPLSASF